MARSRRLSASPASSTRAGARPYLQGRIGISASTPAQRAVLGSPAREPQAATAPAPANGVGYVCRVQLANRQERSRSTSGFYTYYKTSSATCPARPAGRRPGGEWRAASPAAVLDDAARSDAKGRAGELPQASRSASAARRTPDAWGVPRSWGWATAEMFAISWGASMLQQYVRDASQPDQPAQHKASSRKLRTTTTSSRPTSWSPSTARPATAPPARTDRLLGQLGVAGRRLRLGVLMARRAMSYNDADSTGFGGIARGEVRTTSPR